MRNHGDVGERRLAVILESRAESANVAESLIDELSQGRYGEKQRHEIVLAVREAMANAILHGNRFDVRKRVYLTAELDELGMRVSVRDEGEGCEPERVPDPLASHNILRDSGRGMLLMRACMDEVIWRRPASGGTEVIMTKYFAQLPAVPCSTPK